MTPPPFDVVVPTLGRPSLAALLAAIGACAGPRPGRVIVVDDRADARGGVEHGRLVPWLDERLLLLRSGGGGPAAARNAGWRASDGEWVAFLDDDVLVPCDWLEALGRDLSACGPAVAGSQGRVSVPLPRGRRPTDWERNVAGLERAQWATADLAYRRTALLAIGGFDERFPRAYREDADLGLRVTEHGWRILRGTRLVEHPVRDADPWVSVRLQAGNADDVLMRALHGRGWRRRAGVPRGRLPAHLATTAAGVGGLVAAAAGRRALATAGATAWLAGTGELAWARVAPGPRTAAEVARMVATSALLPAAAAWHCLRGWVGLPRLLADTTRAPGPRRHDAPAPPEAVLLDRDGTLVVDVPYNGDPDRVEPVPAARAAVDRLRAAGVRVAVISNQSGIGRGLLTAAQVEAVNARVDALLGPFDGWFVCPHGPDDGCACRKPAPGLVHQAAMALGVPLSRCAVVGDIGSDVEAAAAAGARGVLVPTAVTLPEEIAAAPEVAPDLAAAVDRLLGSGAPKPRGAALAGAASGGSGEVAA